MKQFLLLLALCVSLSTVPGQVRVEAGVRGYSSFNKLFDSQSETTTIQNLGLRFGAAFNMWSDVQLGIHYHRRTDFASSSLLTATRFPRAAEICSNNQLIRESRSLEVEGLFRFRPRQFERFHTFMGVGVAFAYAPGIRAGDSTVFVTTVRRGNGTSFDLECGYPDGSPFGGAQIALLLAPGFRARLSHRIHAELESQLRYHPLYRHVLVSGIGLNLIYNFY